MSVLAEFTDDNFEQEVMQSDTPVLVDFGAEWCVPCKKLAPLVEELAGEYAGRLKVGQVDVGKSTGVAARFGIMSVPTILLISGGQVKEQISGLVAKKKLVDSIEKHV